MRDPLDALLNVLCFALQIKTSAQLDAAFAFLAAVASENLKVDEFEKACGVGMANNTCSPFLLWLITVSLLLLCQSTHSWCCIMRNTCGLLLLILFLFFGSTSPFSIYILAWAGLDFYYMWLWLWFSNNFFLVFFSLFLLPKGDFIVVHYLVNNFFNLSACFPS